MQKMWNARRPPPREHSRTPCSLEPQDIQPPQKTLKSEPSPKPAKNGLQLRPQLEGKLATLSKVWGPNLPEALEVHSGTGEGSGQVRGRGHQANLPRPQPAQGSSLTFQGLPPTSIPILGPLSSGTDLLDLSPLSPPHLLGSVRLSAARKQLKPSVWSLPPTRNTQHPNYKSMAQMVDGIGQEFSLRYLPKPVEVILMSQS